MTIGTRPKRLFIDIEEGQIHARWTPAVTPGHHPPLLLLHASPVSSALLGPFAGHLAQNRDVIAFDTLGQGDSSPPRSTDESAAYFADAALRALKQLGPDFATVDVFGTHTGGRIAAEMAIASPLGIRRVVMDGMRRMPSAHYDSYADIVDLSRHMDHDGSQFFKAWHKWRDEYLFTPPFRWSLERLSGAPLPSVRAMHDAAIEVFKSILHGHVAYRAAIRFNIRDRLPLITQPALVTCARRDGGFSDLGYARDLLRQGSALEHADRVEYASGEDLQAFAIGLTDWLNGNGSSPKSYPESISTN